MTVSNTPSNLLARYRVLFSGDVQGVGFRYTTLQLARRYPTITGYVRNLPSGQVSLVVEGKKNRYPSVFERYTEPFSGIHNGNGNGTGAGNRGIFHLSNQPMNGISIKSKE